MQVDIDEAAYKHIAQPAVHSKRFSSCMGLMHPATRLRGWPCVRRVQPDSFAISLRSSKPLDAAHMLLSESLSILFGRVYGVLGNIPDRQARARCLAA